MPLDSARMTIPDLRPDLRLIADLIEPGSRVLDVGCGDGALLEFLAQTKRVDARGIEISQEGVNACVSNGLSVIQGDADTDLMDYPSGAFDYVVLGKTLQATHNPRRVMEELVRIGRFAMVSFANFGHWRTRLALLFGGRVPVTANGDGVSWFDNPDIHHCTVLDFVELADALGLVIEKGYAMSRAGNATPITHVGWRTNLESEQAVFQLRKA